MKLKSILLLFAAVSVTFFADAQSFLKRIPKPSFTQADAPQLSGAENPVVVPTTMNAVRPVLNVVAYAEPGHILMAGAGAAYEHLKWDATKEKWEAQWSISAVMFGGSSTTPEQTKTTAVSYGLLFGAFNNLVNVGVAINDGKPIAVVGIGLPLNN